MKCKECDSELGNDAKFCGKCGRPISSGNNKIKCDSCGTAIDNNLDYCPKCGKSTYSRGQDSRRNRDKEDDDDDEDGGGIFGGVGDLIGKIFG